ncbi:hypothetical protein [Nocardia terpenica]|uniref:Uncharacterized protein n=1 Tax=Nocardia terpenica TaxID=455432 RepID=A0A164MER7_9NOCA|nr:hypothetical protein [Nocardia terpenica]KZM73292.1 hypothetical protein AWN90_32025 [Nocardia terpenica]NQE87558.1 hypothetical protein [Nocardia terpenica]
MSDTTSEVDQITHALSSLGHRVHHVISTWRAANPTARRVPRSVRREINHLIKADNQEREFAHAQERARIERQVIEYRSNLLRDREIRSWDTQATWFERQRQLAVRHEQLRGSIYTTGHLTAIERGRADRALAIAHTHPHIPVKAVFGKPRGLEALKARLHDGFTRLRAGLAGPAEQRRLRQWQQLHHERAAQAIQTLDRSEALARDWENQPIDLVPVEMPTRATAPTSPPAEPEVSLSELTARIDLYAEVLRYRDQYRGDNPETMKPFDHANARMRDRILADARKLGPEQAALINTALSHIDHVHRDQPAPGTGPAEQDRADRHIDQNPVGDGSGPARPQQVDDRGYQVTVATAEFLSKHPELADRTEVTSLTDGYTWALDQLADDAKGWPDQADLVVEMRRPGDKAPIYQATGPRGMVIDEVVSWQIEHDKTPLAELEQLRTELRAARAENDRLRVENTDLVRKFADNDLTRQPTPGTAAAAPRMPGGPKLAQPIFAGPIITRPVVNGLDR